MRPRVLSTVFLLALPVAAQEKSPSPFRFYWPAEALVAAVGIAGGLWGQDRLTSMRPVDSSDLHRADLDPWDRPLAGTYNSTAAHVSDVLIIGVGGSMLLADAWKGSVQKGSWRPLLEDAVMLGEAYAWSTALNLNVRALRVHPRPLTYAGSGAPDSERQDPEAAGSFYSGHASGAFLGAAYLATVYPLRHPEFQHRALLWTGAMLAASTVAGLRVMAGKHFLSDVVVGAAVGTLLGAGLPLLHWRAPPGGVSGSLGLSPLPGGGIRLQATLAVAGQRESGNCKVLSAPAVSRGFENR